MTVKIIASLLLIGAIPMAAAQGRDKDQLQKTLLAGTTGSKADGKLILDKVCITCHKVGDAGKEIGPDLTTIAATRTRPEIIESLLWPSRVMADQYKPDMVQTKDGDVFVGLVTKENARAITLVTAEHPETPVEILKSKIQDRQKSSTSTMPENLLDAYTPEQIQGLIALLLSGPGRL
jgi:putative heme-binding domain-containing protein